jgi:hypothetical protein
MTRDEQLVFHLRAALAAINNARRNPNQRYAAKRNIDRCLALLTPPEPVKSGELRNMDAVLNDLGAEIDRMRNLIMSEVVRRLGPPPEES